MPREDVLRLRPNALTWLEVEGEVVALDTRTSTYLAVNAAGAVLWPALEAGATRGELVRRLVEGFALDESTASADVEAFLQALESHDLLLREG
ncbi:MAG: PqqD family protein [Actinomycetota bacterium]